VSFIGERVREREKEVDETGEGWLKEKKKFRGIWTEKGGTEIEPLRK